MKQNDVNNFFSHMPRNICTIVKVEIKVFSLNVINCSTKFVEHTTLCQPSQENKYENPL